MKRIVHPRPRPPLTTRLLLPLALVLVFVWGTRFAAAEPAGPAEPDPPTSPESLLAAIDARAEQLTPLRYGAVRVTHRLGSRVEERWRFVNRGDGAFRIDYSGDTVRQVICDGQVLWDYIPEARKARRLDLMALSAQERTRALSSVLQKVHVPGVRVGVEATDMTWSRVEPPPGTPTGAMVLEGRNETGGRILATLDADGTRLLGTEIWEGENFVVRVEARDHVEVLPGVWFPRRVETTAPAEGGEARVELHLSRIVAKGDLPDSLFEISIDSSVAVETLP